MGKNIYFLILSILVGFMCFAKVKILPNEIEERNIIQNVVIQYKNQEVNQIYQTYAIQNQQKKFSKTNKELVKHNQLFLVTKSKYINKMKKDKSIQIIERSDFNRYVNDSEEKHIINLYYDKVMLDMGPFRLFGICKVFIVLYSGIGGLVFLYHKLAKGRIGV